MKAAKQSKERPCCVHLIENWGEVKRGEAEKTVILDYKDFLSWEMWKWTKNGKVSASKVDYLFSALEEGSNASLEDDVAAPGNIIFISTSLYTPP